MIAAITEIAGEPLLESGKLPKRILSVLDLEGMDSFENRRVCFLRGARL